MPPQIKQAKLETLEAIIKEVEGWIYKYDNYPTMMVTKKAHERGLMARELGNDLLTKLQAQKDKIEKEIWKNT